MKQAALVKNARLAGTLEPSEGFWDVRVRDGMIVTIGQGLQPEDDETVLDAGRRTLSPGLIDIHTHVYPTPPLGIAADTIGIVDGVTTVMDAGTSGPANFKGFAEECARTQRTRVLAWINCSRYGLVHGLSELDSLSKLASDEELEPFVSDPRVVGLKIRASRSVVGTLGLSPVKSAAATAKRLGMKVLVHVGNAPPAMRDVLDLLSDGDVLTHAFNGKPDGILDAKGKVIPQAIAARERGVLFDVGHGNASFSVTVARKCLDQGFGPDTISSDLHAQSLKQAGSMPLILSKFMALGYDVKSVLEMATSVVSRHFKLRTGILGEGYAGDLVLWDIVDGNTVCQDSDGNRINLERRLSPVWVMKDGVLTDESRGT